jgi:hypothetical protein
MKLGNIAVTALVASTILLPSYAVAGDINSKLTNQSKENGSDGYYLVQETIIGENGCVKVEGDKKLNPGDSAQLKIKEGCKWGVVRYKIYNVLDNKEIGKLGHSFHDGNFTTEIIGTCKGNDCSFTGITAEQSCKAP